ncbi:hypothetical protein ACGFI9_37365 [Micromonospora sp. NPDC048930]|uniref:hypothetical protein n=1 Tax=Micromonospora sp. NPDC048930 TaxID=3364261 RepID=UPI00371D855F
MGAKSLNNLGRQRAAVPTVIGRCKVYGDPIRTGDDTVWLTDPMGLSHRECKAKADELAQMKGGA